jgi:nucleotide-binding universal stress UspA family protein
MKKILVALDGSPRADGVLEHAVALAGLTGAKLVLHRSFGIPASMPDHVWALPEGSLIDSLRTGVVHYLDECAKAVPAPLLHGVRADVGVPWQAVCSAAKQENADLVVIGAHGYSGVDHVLGTTAARIVNHIDRPLLVVRPVPVTG